MDKKELCKKGTAVCNYIKAHTAQAVSFAGAFSGMAMAQINAYATNSGLSFRTDYSINENNAMNLNIEGLILGITFWIARIVGLVLLVWGLYAFLTARKDGEVEGLSNSIFRIITGAVLMAFPNILDFLGLISI